MNITLASPAERNATIKQQFFTQGYCVVDGLFAEEILQEIEIFFEEFKTFGGKVFNGDSLYAEVDPTQRQVRAMNPHRYSPQVMNWLTHPPVAEILQLLFDRPPLGAQTMYYYKPPGAKGQGMHQDDFYLLTRPTNCLAAWTPIDDATVENGCLYVVPGSQESGILCPEKEAAHWMNYGDSHITRFPRETKPIPVEVKRGQTMFFGGQLIHGSGPNRTKDRFRRTFIGHYIDEATESVSHYYHPLVNMKQETVSTVKVHEGGGPCGDGWQGRLH
jgi:ectoine hydroxylase-related dioxygenase (phytanoyl-CoA dioxygenase family)